MLNRLLTGLGLVCSLTTSTALASPTIEFFGGASAINTLSPRVLSTGPDAAYFNASLLPRLDPQFTIGIFLFSE